MTTHTDAWTPEPGACAYILTSNRLSHAPTVTRVTVDRVTKRDVVVTDRDGKERRFRRAQLTEYGERDAWTPTPMLVDPKDRKVREALAARRRRVEGDRLRRLAFDLDAHGAAMMHARTDDEATREAAAAEAAVREWLDGHQFRDVRTAGARRG